MEIMASKDSHESNDYFWAMSTSIFKDDGGDDWKQRRAIPLQRKRVSDNQSDNSLTTEWAREEHTRIFASLVPDEVIYHINDYSRRYFEGCLLFGDVSGFTDLCEKYNKTGKGGPSKLTQVLNSYIGAMVQEILSHDGDVFKFSGDAFIALWKVTENLSMKDAVHEAIDCSLVIQKTYGRYQADQDVVIRVKLAISAGPLVFSLLGTETNSHYALLGTPIWDLKAAESQSFAGDIIITKTAWQHVSPNEYLAEELKDGINAKIFGVGPNWRNIQRTTAYSKEEKYSIITATDNQVSDTNLGDEEDLDEQSEMGLNDKRISDASEVNQVVNTNDQYALRPSVNMCIRLKMIDALKRFILEPVEKGIMADEPIEYLTEIRQVTILFINCKMSHDASFRPLKMLDTVDKVYITVSNIVKNNYGCLNKVNMFDKDLLVLVIFGLRGLKHEMECQIALKCAKECYDNLTSTENIKSVGAAVTTGKTYCGAFGHSLRREYTVISLIVNKAARLMVAYPNKVTCDRETFLHSKLEAKNFILQEYKPLKGIVNPGPIYEFKEVESTRDVALSVSIHPLLGREQEIDLYLHLYNIAKECAAKQNSMDEFFGMLVIQGESRQGKTRLLEEIIYTTDPKTPISRFTLTKVDSEKPYTSIQLLFNSILGLTEKSSMSRREEKILKRLRKVDMTNQGFVLNDIFNINFKTPFDYASMDKKYKYKQLKKVFKGFCLAAFHVFWVIAIDNSEYIDDESWILISILTKLNLVFIISTMGLRSMISPVAMEVLKMSKIKIIQMKPIDKWYHCGLACQMLDVEAIPADLEKVIQERSNGNPGWIESFLITLLQSNGLYIKTITRKLAYDNGLILPPLYMMMRLSEGERDLWIEIMEEGGVDKIENRWKMYIDSCRESFPDLTVAKSLKDKFDLYAAIRVCVLNPAFNVDEVEPELAMDVIILKTFDALTSYEQLLIKCSAILGNIFPRDMLMYIMSSSAVRLTALAVKKLFEIHVLSCARGNFVEGGLIFKERLKNPNEETEVTCQCRGLIIDENCQDLPKYASCGYMRFLSTSFRETTYNLLTDNQKREFHARAIRYLEKETRKCRACGNGYFTRYMGNKLDYELKANLKKKKRRIRTSSITSDTGSIYTIDKDGRFSMYSRDSGYSAESRNMSKSTKDSGQTTTSIMPDSIAYPSSRSIEDEIETDVPDFDLGIGLRTIKKYQNDFNITRTFSDTDYSQCTCPLILTTMYVQMIEHCSGAGLIEKMMSAMIDFCYVCIESDNVPQALKILYEALSLLEGPMKETTELDWMITLKRGKLYTIMGFARMKLEQYNEGYKHLQDALECYGLSFPENKLSSYLHKMNLKFQQNMALYLFPSRYTTKSTDDDVSNYYNDVSECLGYLCDYYLIQGQYKHAKLAAIWSLKQAKWSNTDFSIVCMAYSNMIRMCTYFGEQRQNIALEVFAFEICNKKRSTVEREELKAVGNLYCSIFFARISRCEIEKSIHIGYILWRIGSSTHLVSELLMLLPMLVMLILMRRHIIEAGNIMQDINLVASGDVDISGKCWYYALCVNFHLETGLIIEPIRLCIAFSQSEGREPSTRDPDASRRLIVALWLWNVRTENWENTFIWEEEVMRIKIKKGESSENLITAVYLLEGLIITMVKKMDKKSIVMVEYLTKKITDLFKVLFKASKSVKIIMPRLYHLKAYYNIVKTNNYPQTLKMMNRATKIAKKFGNDMEASWITHNEQAWCNKLSKTDKNFWRTHCEDENHIEYNENDEYTEKFGHYSLPIPVYL
ncbi:adenylate cyclase type 10-like [Rhynchophorus ferrugineus]|uniref:adenylate cyclase type 10-like n=1 Tax=Rhynchophorus ferrugineus TaxID=354439 RepID=UPI003FCDD758